MARGSRCGEAWSYPQTAEARRDTNVTRPEQTTLYAVVRDNLATLYGAMDEGALAVRLSKTARRELEAYLDCGLLCRGFARLRCGSCRESRLVAFTARDAASAPRASAATCAPRTVQPVLLEADVAHEEAAVTLGASPLLAFRKVTLPALWPAIRTGTLLSFSRALGEFGSIVIVSGNIPRRTLTAAVLIYGEIESGHPEVAAAVSTLLLAIAFTAIVLVETLQRRRIA